MNHPFSTSQHHRPLDRRMDALTLGVGAVAATAAAGVALPQKAEAALPIQEVFGFQVNNANVEASGNEFLNIQLNPFDSSYPAVQVMTGFQTRGWNLQFAYGEFVSGNGYAYLGNYEFLPNFYSDTATANLATYTGWSSGFYVAPVSSGENHYLGLHATVPSIYGWVNIVTGSITHLQSAFNFDPAGAISIGQTMGDAIPEPSRAVLLAGGLAGLALARRKRPAAASSVR